MSRKLIMTWVMALSVLAGTLTLVAIMVVALVPASPLKSKQQQGQDRYNEVYNLLVKEHINLLDDEHRQSFAERWEKRYLKEDMDLSTDEKADIAIAFMVSSLGGQFDSFRVPDGNVLRRMVRVDPVDGPGIKFAQAPLPLGPPAHPGVIPGAVAPRAPALPAVLPAFNIPAHPDAVELVHVGDGIFWLRISTFDQWDTNLDLIESLRAALTVCRDQGCRGLILDLVDNGGGHMHVATALCEMLVPAGQITITREREGEHIVEKSISVEGPYRTVRTRKYDKHGNGVALPDRQYDREPLVLPASVPITIIINGNSASASEMVAACLQVGRKAVLIGKKSFGKGVFQHVHRLAAGRLLSVTGGEWRASPVAGIHRRGLPADLDANGNVPGYRYSDGVHNSQVNLARAVLKASAAEMAVLWKAHAVPRARHELASDWMLGPAHATGELDTPAGQTKKWILLTMGAVVALVLYMLFNVFLMLLRKQTRKDAIAECNVAEKRDQLVADYRLACRFLNADTGEEGELVLRVDQFADLVSRLRKGEDATLAIKEVAEQTGDEADDIFEQVSAHARALAALAIAQLSDTLSQPDAEPFAVTAYEQLSRAEEMLAIGDANNDAECYLHAVVYAVEGLKDVMPCDVVEVVEVAEVAGGDEILPTFDVELPPDPAAGDTAAE